MYKKIPHESLTATKMNKLHELFVKKKWCEVNALEVNEFELFCKMLEYFNEEQQDLILELTNDFLRVGFAEQLIYFIKAFMQFSQSTQYLNCRNVYISPLKTEEDINNTKSSDALLYQVKCYISHIRERFPTKSLKITEKFDKLLSTETIIENDVICLLDDYIGTGETAASAIEYAKAHSINNIVIIALVGQRVGVSRIKEMGINIFVAEERKKGITDLDQSEESITRKIGLMEDIEKIVKPRESFRFGYGHSEALVQMGRTPNNTFPVFWHNSKEGINSAPFPRY